MSETRKKVNLNELAKAVCEQEGGKVNLPIAQVKEVIRVVLEELSFYRASAVMAVVERAKYGA